MLFLVRFTDRPNSAAIREKFLAEHFAWLDTNAARIPVAGAIREVPGTPPVASIWVVSGESPEDVLALVDADPFWRNGLRATREVFHYAVHSALMKREGFVS